MMEEIKKLREKTGAGVMDAKRALDEANGNMSEAEKIIRASGIAKADKKAERSTGSGRVYCYSHQTGKVAVMVEVACETDFVANTTEFSELCKEIAMQIASMEPKDVDELMNQDYIRDSSQKIGDLVKAFVGKTGENTKIVRFVRYELGE